MIVVYVGDVADYLSKLVCSIDPTATLITTENYKNLYPGTYYTSIGDLEDLSQFGYVLRNANQIVYAPPPNNKWSDDICGTSQMKQWTEDYLKTFSFYKSVDNFLVDEPSDKDIMLQLSDFRKSDNQQLWCVGCSISDGEGVDINQRYGQLISNEVNLPVSFLTKCGSSIIWAADQILRSDIQQGDIVLWGLTSTPRAPWFNNNELIHISPSLYCHNSDLRNNYSFEYFTSDDIMYRTVISIFQVINFCQKVGANLLLVSLMDDGSIIKYLKNCPNILHLGLLWGRGISNRFIDTGNDGEHPGPKTHKFYADSILNKMKQLEWI